MRSLTSKHPTSSTHVSLALLEWGCLGRKIWIADKENRNSGNCSVIGCAESVYSDNVPWCNSRNAISIRIINNRENSSTTVCTLSRASSNLKGRRELTTLYFLNEGRQWYGFAIISCIFGLFLFHLPSLSDTLSVYILFTDLLHKNKTEVTRNAMKSFYTTLVRRSKKLIVCSLSDLSLRICLNHLF